MENKPLPHIFKRLVFASLLLTGMLSAVSGFAQTYYSPGSNINFTGGGNVIPLGYPVNNTVGLGNMAQWLYMPADFNSTPPSGFNITTIYFKPASNTSFTFTDLTVKMGNTTLTNLTSGPWNTGLTTVYYNASVSVTSTANSWYQITLQTPFFYTGGNFIVELSQQSTAQSNMSINQHSPGGTRRMHGMTTNTNSNGADGTCAVFGFDAVPANCSGTPTAPTITTTPFPAATPLCAGASTTINASNPNFGNGLTLMWQSSTSATGPWTNVTTGSGATTVSYTTGPLSTSTYFRFGVTCTNSNITSYSTPFLVPIGSPQPGTITGNSTYCPGDTATYAVPFVSGTTYNWTLPSGWTGVPTGNTILVTPGPGTSPATISVTATSSCGPASIARSRTIAPGSAPGPPGTILGSNHICAGTTQTYSVIPVGGATGYIWTLPTGWTGASSSNSITVTANSSPGNITVKAINGCGQSNTTTLPVTIISTLARPGRISGPDTVCSGTLQSYSIAPVPGATSYVWTLPSGWSGTTTGTSIQAFPGSSTGIIRVTAYVSCSISPSSDTVVVVRQTVNPSVAISVPPTTLCQGTPITITATPAFPGTSPTYAWRKNGQAVIAFGNTYTTNALQKGDSISVTMTSNAACAANTTAVSNTLYPNITPAVVPGVSINTTPPITVCKGTPVTFTTTSSGTGSAPTYQWYKNGGVIAGQTGTSYTDAGLNHADTITVVMGSNAVCATSAAANSNKVGVSVTERITPTVSISVAPSEVISAGTPLTFTATQSHGGATPDYQWTKNGVNIPFATGDVYSSNELRPGDHIAVKMLSYAECVDTALVSSNTIVLKSSLGVGGRVMEGASVRVYPNPSAGQLRLRAGGWQGSGEVMIEVVSVTGQQVYAEQLRVQVREGMWEAGLSLPAGVADGPYMLRISSKDGSFTSALPFVLNR